MRLTKNLVEPKRICMHKDTSLAALQAIDVIVYKSSHQELRPEDLAELQGACTSLLQGVEGTSPLANKALAIIELIQLAFFSTTRRPRIHREEILHCGIALSILIQKQPESALGAGAGER